MNIADQLEQMMKEKGVNRRQLAIGSGVPYTTIDGILKRDSDVKLSTLIKLADYFQTSIDYLAGRESSLSLAEYNEMRMYQKFLEWRRENG